MVRVLRAHQRVVDREVGVALRGAMKDLHDGHLCVRDGLHVAVRLVALEDRSNMIDLPAAERHLILHSVHTLDVQAVQTQWST